MILTGSIGNIQSDQPIIAEKPPAVDEQFDSLLQIGLNNYTGYKNGTNVSRGTWGGNQPSKEVADTHSLDSLLSLPAEHLDLRLRMMQSQITEEKLQAYRQKKLNEINERIDEILRRLPTSTNK